jgi:hypothetical protein
MVQKCEEQEEREGWRSWSDEMGAVVARVPRLSGSPRVIG